MISIQNAEHYLWGEGCESWHLVKTDQLSIIQERVAPGKGEAKHFHQQANQFFFILEGEAVLEVDNQIHRLAAQQGIYVPAGVVHQMRNENITDVVFTVTSTPKSHGDRVEVNS